jgi:hypothetical protein
MYMKKNATFFEFCRQMTLFTEEGSPAAELRWLPGLVQLVGVYPYFRIHN